MSLSFDRLRRIYADGLGTLSRFDFIAPLLLRLYLAPIFWMAGWSKLQNFDDTVEWFGNSEWGLGLPLPQLMAGLATGTELIGAVLLLVGLGVRLVSVPLMCTMLVAIFTVHWPNGWLAVAEGEGLFASMRTMEAVERLAQAKALLREHGDYEYLTEYGNLVMLNNGIEFGATYWLMLLTLLFAGAGRWLSLDWWIARGKREPSASRAFQAAYQ
ncbi:MAG: HvfX family Cu-binding RiPP maturation protein [Panacagrimonas sp.]